MQTTYPDSFSPRLDENLSSFKQIFTYPKNKALKIRNIHIASLNKEAALLYVEGIVDIQAVEMHLLDPLLRKYGDGSSLSVKEVPEFLISHVLENAQCSVVSDPKTVIEQLTDGYSIVLIDGMKETISVDTAKFEQRQIAEPKVENAVKGPKEAFVESAASNVSLIRKQIRSPDLIHETMKVGKRSNDTVSILYMKSIANPDIVEEMKSRIAAIDADSVLQLTMLEQLLEERPYSLVPSMMTTERPDRATSFLLDGQIALIMENSPATLIAPITFWTLFQTAEDMHLRWGYGNFVRFIRLFCLFIALLTPSIYIAISTFHIEMLPTDLMLAISAARERVPFSSIIEVLFMEVCFEILREASLRIPTIIGSTIGIVGALILGQAAVEANIVSPILVVIVAITGLSSFAIADTSLNFAIRIMRFIMLIAASCIGFYGIAIVMTILLTRLVSYQSIGVPFFSPFVPYEKSSGDLIFRPIIKKQKRRPPQYRPQDPMRRK